MESISGVAAGVGGVALGIVGGLAAGSLIAGPPPGAPTTPRVTAIRIAAGAVTAGLGALLLANCIKQGPTDALGSSGALAGVAVGVGWALARSGRTPSYPRSVGGPDIVMTPSNSPFAVDYPAAREYARQTLDQLDFSRRDLVIWAQGSGKPGMDVKFEAAVNARLGTDASVALLEYPALRDLRASVGTGAETLRLVLEDIGSRGGNHRVLLSGDSQGAWAIDQAMSNPASREVVDRAVLLGHPYFARNHAGPRDTKLIEINSRLDPITVEPPRATGDHAIDAYAALGTPKLGEMPAVARLMVWNPWSTKQYAKDVLSYVPGVRALIDNPHDYRSLHPDVAKFLDSGDIDGLATSLGDRWDLSYRGATP